MALVGRVNMVMILVTLLTIATLYYRLRRTSAVGAPPSPPSPDETPVFIDIPFCGPPSILEWIESHVKPPCGCDGCECAVMSRHNKTCGTNPSYNNYKQCLGEGTRYLTALCDPVLRTIREFEYQRTQRTNFWSYCNMMKRYEHSTCSQLQSLEEFLACPNNPALNRQVKMLSDITCEFNNMTPRYLQAMLDSAIVNLEKFSYVGIVEYWRDSIRLLQDTLPELQDTLPELQDTEQVTEATLYNVTQPRVQYNVTQEMVERIRKANEGDMKLWYHALRLFSARVEYAGITDSLLHAVEYPSDLPGPYDRLIEHYVYLEDGRYRDSPDNIYI